MIGSLEHRNLSSHIGAEGDSPPILLNHRIQLNI